MALYPFSCLTLTIECGLCGDQVRDESSWEDGSDSDEVLAIMAHAPETFDYDVFAGSIFCPPCLKQFKEETCLHRHPIDNHMCMRYAGHEGDHECCKRHMFY